MQLRRGTRARFTLLDGTTLEGTVRWSWMWSTVRISRVHVNSAAGAQLIAGTVLIPKRSVVFVQVLFIDVDPEANAEQE